MKADPKGCALASLSLENATQRVFRPCPCSPDYPPSLASTPDGFVRAGPERTRGFRWRYFRWLALSGRLQRRGGLGRRGHARRTEEGLGVEGLEEEEGQPCLSVLQEEPYDLRRGEAMSKMVSAFALGLPFPFPVPRGWMRLAVNECPHTRTKGGFPGREVLSDPSSQVVSSVHTPFVATISTAPLVDFATHPSLSPVQYQT